ncbi:hypothetical protein [Chitinophaga sp. sic0106]|uniref:hypothetical protein n=1 Tax=Chitinophaga sp. sic0106 TaxID=2854785 RepID=UPI001C44B044|nr:hypothetical protein [Chitinophaga sp. sic0106]MBV7531269.1 hypothetical protein [Chitinophaga sp. sic0106]
MIKKLVVAASLYCVLASGVVYSQIPKVTLSEAIEEPRVGLSKLLLLKNGTTMYFHFPEQGGIATAVYDQNYRKTASVQNQIKSFPLSKMHDGMFEGIFEINGQVVAFFTHVDHRVPTLYRFVFEEQTGKILHEDVVTSAPQIPKKAGYGILGRIEEPAFLIEKDPLSGYYAVATLNEYPHEINQRIKITHYSPMHEVINEGYITTPTDKFRYMNLKTMTVHGDEFVLAGTSIHNPAVYGSRDKEFSVIVSQLTKGNKVISNQLLASRKAFVPPEIVAKFNPSRNLVFMMSVVNDGRTIYLNTVDPYSSKISDSKWIQHPGLTNYSIYHLGDDKPYRGTIQDFYLHEDGSATMMYEEMVVSQGGGANAYYVTRMGGMGISRISDKGEELPGSYFLAKNQYTSSEQLPLLMYRRAKGCLDNKGNGGFDSYDFIQAGNHAYFIYNDLKENIDTDSVQITRGRAMVAVSGTNTVLAWKEGEEIKRIYLFGDPGKADISRFSNLAINAHASDGKSYATLLIERNGSNKKAYIAWVKF